MSKDLLNIKKYYGEGMMHLCRELFPTLLEQEGLLFRLIQSNFAYSKILYDDLIERNFIDEFKNYIYNLVTAKKQKIITNKTPEELLKEANYILYECKTEEDIQKFKKYYEEDEQLCTFTGGRLNNCYVFFAIKKNVDKIRRKDFLNPSRQDEYGTSVISIQFSRGKNNTLSIKNRYNNTVDNPDATYSNNLENIVPGLTTAFERKYNLNINQNNSESFIMSDYVLASDGKYYKYNYKINNVYYCIDNIILDDSKVIMDYQEKEKFLVIDYFIIDLFSKNIRYYDENIVDPFINDRFDSIKLIEIVKDNQTKHKKIGIVLKNLDHIYIEVDKNNRMIYYYDNNIKIAKKGYLWYCSYLQEINMPALVKTTGAFAIGLQNLTKFIAPNLREIGNDFLTFSEKLSEIDLPNCEKIGNGFLEYNTELSYINLPKVKSIGYDFLSFNKKLYDLDLPSVEMIGQYFLSHNTNLQKLNTPKLCDINEKGINYEVKSLIKK